MHILISGASVAGPVLAYWLHRYGFEVTIVERAPTLRKTGGHAVDLFRPAMQIMTKMALLKAIREKATGTETLVMHRAGAKPLTVDLRKVYTAVSDDHVEIMRDDLSEILYDATSANVEYVFGESITSISDDGEVSFEHSPSRRFDVIVGADGLHSNVRGLTFGPEAGFSTWIGAYLSVVSMGNYLNLDGVMETVAEVGRIAGVYSAAHMDDARAIFLFRTPEPLEYHHRDVPRQKQLLREHFADMDWEVPRLLAELDDTPAFYFDSITQLRLDTWSRGRVTLVGDAGYCPGPAVGGSTSLAVVGAYILAGELATHAPEHSAAFAAYESEIGDYVKRSRTFAISAAKRVVPARPLDLWMLVQAARFVDVLPASVSRGSPNSTPAAFDCMTASLSRITRASYSDRMSAKDHPNNAPGVPMKFPPLVERLQIKYFNPLIRPIARFLPSFATIKHRGRTSGKEYETVVNAYRKDKVLAIMLAHGKTNWVKNVLAAGEADVRLFRRDVHIVNPRVLPAGSDDPTLPSIARRGARSMGVFVADIA